MTTLRGGVHAKGGSLRPLTTSDHAEVGEIAICVEGLVKQYGAVRAVDTLTFSVARGEVFALLGRNGAGKTTTIEILEGYRAPDAGTVAVLGADPTHSHELKQRLGIMPQQSALYPLITVREALRLFCAYYRHPADPTALLQLIGLEEKAEARFKSLSGGQKQRLSLGLAMAGNPELIFLDEPTAAMDPQGRAATWDLIAGLRRAGITLVLTTHYLEEAQRLADHVAIIDHGKLVALGTPAELMARAGTGTLRFTGPEGLEAAELALLPGAGTVREERPGLYAMTGNDLDELLVEIALWSRERGIQLKDLRVERATLEEVFLALTSTEARGDAGPGDAKWIGRRRGRQRS